MFSFASFLFHKVGQWTPLPPEKTQRHTSGRISEVGFTPANVIRLLEKHAVGNHPGWLSQTAGGTAPQLRPTNKEIRAEKLETENRS